MKKLYRSSKDRMISGVCAGIAEYFDVDATLVRIGAVVVLFMSWFSLVLGYIVCAIIMPERPAGQDEEEVEIYDKDGNRIYKKKTNNIISVLLIGIGLFFLATHFMPAIDKNIMIGGALLLAGLLLFANRYTPPSKG